MVLVVISYVASVLNGAADFFFGILPIFIVKDLNMRRNTKIVVAAILGFAAIGSLSTLVRLPYVKQLGTYKGGKDNSNARSNVQKLTPILRVPLHFYIHCPLEYRRGWYWHLSRQSGHSSPSGPEVLPYSPSRFSQQRTHQLKPQMVYQTGQKSTQKGRPSGQRRERYTQQPRHDHHSDRRKTCFRKS
jgi:hypothetical protein